jgi:hypothetical protein
MSSMYILTYYAITQLGNKLLECIPKSRMHSPSASLHTIHTVLTIHHCILYIQYSQCITVYYTLCIHYVYICIQYMECILKSRMHSQKYYVYSDFHMMY